jgi:hypothetical protein
VSLSHELDINFSIFVGNYNADEPVTTLTCVPGQNIVLVTLGSTFFKVDLDSSEVDKLPLPTYKYLVWVGVDHAGANAYVGAEVYTDTASSDILQIVL